MGQDGRQQGMEQQQVSQMPGSGGMPPFYQANGSLEMARQMYPGYETFSQGPLGYPQVAGGQFVAGIPVLHVLKTPRDPTMRLSGVDIAVARGMRASPEIGEL